MMKKTNLMTTKTRLVRKSKDLKEHAIKITNYEKKKCHRSYLDQTSCHSFKKVRDHFHYTGTHRRAADSICNVRYEKSKEIFAVLHNGSNYDFHFIIKELAEKIKWQLECLGENQKKKKKKKKIDNVFSANKKRNQKQRKEFFNHITQI